MLWIVLQTKLELTIFDVGKYQASQTQLDEFVDSYRNDGVKNVNDANDACKRIYDDGALSNESKCKDAEPQHGRSKISPQMTDVHTSARKSRRRKRKEER